MSGSRTHPAQAVPASIVTSLALILALGLTLTPGGTVLARTWHVPGDVATIKAALEDSSSYGDTVLVAAATYDTTSGESFPITMGNGVVLLSDSGAEMTTIDANSTERVLDCIGLDAETVIAGFTIAGGSQIDGAGIYCVDSYVEIRDNIITGNVVTALTSHGGGIYCSGGAPAIVGNQIIGNKARKNMGGGIFCGGGSAAVIENNRIDGNVAKYGGGIFMQYCGPVVKNNTVIHNRSLATGGHLQYHSGQFRNLRRGGANVGQLLACCLG
jgi:hypothetical protein